jgi:hypothetical protein
MKILVNAELIDDVDVFRQTVKTTVTFQGNYNDAINQANILLPQFGFQEIIPQHNSRTGNPNDILNNASAFLDRRQNLPGAPVMRDSILALKAILQGDDSLTHQILDGSFDQARHKWEAEAKTLRNSVVQTASGKGDFSANIATANTLLQTFQISNDHQIVQKDGSYVPSLEAAAAFMNDNRSTCVNIFGCCLVALKAIDLGQSSFAHRRLNDYIQRDHNQWMAGVVNLRKSVSKIVSSRGDITGDITVSVLRVNDLLRTSIFPNTVNIAKIRPHADGLYAAQRFLTGHNEAAGVPVLIDCILALMALTETNGRGRARMLLEESHRRN